MKRSKKVALALGVAVAVHLILFFSLSPRLEGLAADEPASADIAAAPAEPIAEAAPPAMPDEPLDETWPEPADEPEARPERAKPAAPVKTAKAVVTPPPVPEPVIAAPAAPAAISTDRNYASRVRQHLGRFAGALPAGASGEARVQFVVEVDGLVSDVHLVQFSGHAGLDAMALNLPTQAQPLPLPGQLPQRLEVPLQAAP